MGKTSQVNLMKFNFHVYHVYFHFNTNGYFLCLWFSILEITLSLCICDFKVLGVGGEPYNPFKAKKKFIHQQHISVYTFNVLGH